ncbi:hypothetical protein QYF61_011140 [Mycteria americana]|uniref:Uncharacterized protein n=1 Tax=Mycteria americana TaxID=33587 RepID=A0AAN7S6Z6_MYCAM|nr:hypothetical protein QYF61_011140 [Mycteria americana]
MKFNKAKCKVLHLAQKTNHIPGCMASRSREVILPLCFILMRPHLEYCIQFWSPQYKKNMDLSERLQRRATKMVTGLDHLSCSRKAESTGVVQPGQEEVPGRSYCGLSVLKGGLKMERDFLPRPVVTG